MTEEISYTTSRNNQSLTLRNKADILFFVVPFIINALNVQAFVQFFISTTISQILAYSMIALVLLGTILQFKKGSKIELNRIIKLWILFFISYYILATFASGLGDEKYQLLRTLVAPIYFFGFTYYFSINNNWKTFVPYITWTFFAVVLISIYLNYINFSFDYDGIAEYKIERSAGIYGDANNSSLASVLGFIFMYYTFKTNTNFQKGIKLFCLFICAYGVLITYSTTGFLAFSATLFLIAVQKISVIKLIIATFLAPFALIMGYNFIINSDIFSQGQKNKIENFANLITLNTEQVNYSDRDRRLAKLFEAIENAPIMGNGLEYGNEVLHSHNTIFNVWADAGLFVFIIFCILLFSYYYKIFKYARKTRYFELSIIIVLSLFMLTLQTIINQAYLMIVFVFLAYLIQNKNNSGDYLEID